MTMIDTMAAAASTRLTQHINRSAGQHARHVRAGFADAIREVMPPISHPVSHFYEAGNVEFAGDEPDEHSDGIAIFGRVIGALAFIVLLTVAVVWVYIKLGA